MGATCCCASRRRSADGVIIEVRIGVRVVEVLRHRRDRRAHIRQSSGVRRAAARATLCSFDGPLRTSSSSTSASSSNRIAQVKKLLRDAGQRSDGRALAVRPPPIMPCACSVRIASRMIGR